METNPQRQTVAGIFPDEASANAALTKLVEANFDVEADASVIVSNHHDRQVIGCLVLIDHTVVIGTKGV